MTADIDLYLSLFDQKTIEEKRFYNFGSGKFRHPMWTNVDHPSEHYKRAQGRTIQICWDMMSGEPVGIPDDTAEIVYSSHVVEHLPDKDALFMIQEAHRCLRKGGVFRLSTIDVDLDYRAYRAGDRHYFNWIEMYSKPKNMKRANIRSPLREASLEQIFLFHIASSASELHVHGVENPISDGELRHAFETLSVEEALDFCAGRCSVALQKRFPGNHISWWNPKKATDSLVAAGFSEVYISGRNQSVSPVLRNPRFFDKTRPTTSLFVEAIK